jgi:hypothetical protein
VSCRSSSAAREQIGDLWLETSKIARKAGHSQTAYSAILQARDLDAPFAFLQSAKLLMANDEEYKAIQTIDNSLQGLLPTIHKTPHPLASTGPPTPLAKVRFLHFPRDSILTACLGLPETRSLDAPSWTTRGTRDHHELQGVH